MEIIPLILAIISVTSQLGRYISSGLDPIVGAAWFITLDIWVFAYC